MSAGATLASRNGRGLAPLEQHLQRRTLVRRGAAVAAATVVCVLAVAVTCRVLFAEQAREWLSFGFNPPAPKLRTALETFSVNVQLAAGCLFFASSVALGRECQATFEIVVYRVSCVMYDLILGAVYVGNVLIVGVSVGAYGLRMVRALLPHGPVELFAFSLALAVYLVARERGVGLSAALRVGLTVVVLLALAAALETWGAG